MAVTVSSPSVHLLPFKINFSGPAKVSTYFVAQEETKSSGDSTTSSTPTSHATDVVFSASFRGRALKGKRYKLPDGYTGFLLKKKKKESTDEDTSSTTSPQGHQIVNRFHALTHWLRDQDPAPELRVKSFVELSIITHALHSKVTPEELKAASLTPPTPQTAVATDLGTKRKREEGEEETREEADKETATKKAKVDEESN